MASGTVASFEKEAFRKRLETLSAAEDISDGDFADAVYTAASRFGLGEDAFRATFGLTQGAVERWTTRKNLPQPLVRAALLRWIAEELQKT